VELLLDALFHLEVEPNLHHGDDLEIVVHGVPVRHVRYVLRVENLTLLVQLQLNGLAACAHGDQTENPVNATKEKGLEKAGTGANE
jgi:hypothetical protein